MSPPDKSFGCPACGMLVTGTERACPRCGRSFGDELKFECPYCGEFIPRTSVKCPFCALDVSKFSDKPSSPPVDKKLSVLLENLIVEEATRFKGEGKRYSCPDCAWLLDGTEPSCPKCGLEFSEKVKIACPICGSSVDKNLSRCPLCDSKLHPDAPQEAPVTIKPQVPIPAPPPPPPPPTEDEVGLQEGLSLRERIRQRQAPQPVEVPPQPKPEVRPPVTPPPAPVPERKETPPKTPPPEQPRPEEDEASPEEALGILGQIAIQETSRSPQPATRTRKLKEGKVTSVVAQKVKPSGPGLSNGIGQVNGAGPERSAGRVNGTGRVNGRVNGRTNGTGRINGRVSGPGHVNGAGAVNGRSLVNGTGVSNGVRGSSKGHRLGGAAVLLRWQFLVVLVAVMVIIPAFIYFSTREHPLYSVDGNFTDWSKATKFGARVQSSSPSIDIREWAVGTDRSDLFLYMHTGSAIMESDLVESVFLFIDSDGLNLTGYSVDALGADYLMQMDGWNGSVQATELLSRSQSSDRYDWNGWTSDGGLAVARAGYGLEAEAALPSPVGAQAQFLLMTKDSQERTSSSYPVPLSGGVLIVHQEPSPDVADDGIVQTVNPATLLSLTFSCEGIGGTVQSVAPSITGGTTQTSGPFSLEPGTEHIVNVTSDLTAVYSGQLVRVALEKSGVSSSFASVVIEGAGASAYVRGAPVDIEIDGAFGDWVGKRLPDQDSSPVTDPAIDIELTGNVSTASASFFYVSVRGEIWNGSFVPAEREKPQGGGGGVVIPERKTGEDVLNIYIDSDRSAATGAPVSYTSKLIGADQKIELKGLDGRITSSAVYYRTGSAWTASSETVEAAKDDSQVEISIDASAIGGSSNIDFIVETTSWKSPGDRATWTQSGMASIQTWPVTSAINPYATSISYQRKIFYDGTNLWSFYFDGSNTVCKYSTDLGTNWTTVGAVFKTSGVNETSIWYDSGNGVVYAVGDTAAASTNVYLQKGTVRATPQHDIVWAGSDSTLAASTAALGGKNTFITRDANGYIWVVSSNYSSTSPKRYDLTAFRSTSINSISAFALSGQMLSTQATADTIKGTIVPSGSGGDVWCVYTSGGNVYSRKYTGTWGGQVTVSSGGGAAVHENSPPCAVVDAKGVVHVVWGTSKSGNSAPTVRYSHNDTGATTYSAPVDLDPWIASDLADYYPTVSLETSTGNVYAMWIRTDTGLVGRSVIVRKLATGSWSNVTLDPQTSYPKQFLTSVYSISGEYMVCWQWTQNTTGTIQVMFDHRVPEFSDLAMPIVFTISLVAIYRLKSKRKA